MRSTVTFARLLPRILTTTALLTTATPHSLAPQHFLSTKHSMTHSTTSFTLEQRKISDNSFAILKDLVQTEQAPRSAAHQAAAAATKDVKQANAKDAVDDGYLFQFWRDLFSAAEQAPSSDHPALDKLVLFVRELSLQGDVEIKVWEKRIWKDLPVLGAALREKLDGPAQARNRDEQDAVNAAWVKFHAFAARLMAANVIDLTTQALWMLRDGLEEQLTAGSKEANREVLTATVWIEYAGPLLFEKILWSPNPTLGDDDKRLLRAGPLYKGGPGLSSDRWLFWKTRLDEVADKKEVTDEAKDAAVRVARLMEVWAETRMQIPQ
ncbi:uncharacterized protein B0I36DRAFT_311095 [Microdochium trichocladiopsis]|uniref:Uncharacterized protein n=1 Tax=Microdochium trichocladiopsis TaxID=1682393 RepID=A0A9P8YKC8_9PEZI|nr:uncharacterized protein B0I36DRAFT_311095 [Microdochium trichocladiopsis]KAH7040615.1 hypothetical protein B0I36DRAFT_311095 [Microdochium trichocladiopsis]